MNISRLKSIAIAQYQSFWHHRYLLFRMIYREVVGRYKGSILGLFWSFFNPIFMLSVYTFVFSVIFKARWGETTGGRADFAITLFAGLIIYSLFSETINRSPSLILGNTNFVKKVVFPLEILSLVALGSALFHALISIFVLLAFVLIIKHHIPYTIIYFPIVLLPLLLITSGVSWILASLGVYLRDINQTISLLTSALLFLSPIFYPVAALPENIQSIILLNPLTMIIEQARDVLIWGQAPVWRSIGLYTLVSFLVAIFGLAWFQKTRKGFADVL